MNGNYDLLFAVRLSGRDYKEYIVKYNTKFSQLNENFNFQSGFGLNELI